MLAIKHRFSVLPLLMYLYVHCAAVLENRHFLTQPSEFPVRFLNTLLIVVLGVVLPDNAYASDPPAPNDRCVIIAEILDVRAGTYEEPNYSDDGLTIINTVTFTEVEVKIDSSMLLEDRLEGDHCGSMTKGKVRTFALCQDITIKPGDKIKAHTDFWAFSPECIESVRVFAKGS